jgi:hypothetical protein
MSPPGPTAGPAAGPAPDVRRLTRFFVPLAVQAASQSLCYPLVAMIAARGPGGTLDLAGLAQSNTVLFFIGMLAISLVPTGMVYARSREGYRRFYRLTLTAGVIAAVVQGALCLPGPAHLLFSRIISLPPSIEAPARATLLASIPLQLLFFSRIPYFVVMYIGQATGAASLATIGRVALTALLTPVFVRLGLVGPLWAVAALTLPVALEAVVSRRFAGAFIDALPAGSRRVTRVAEMIWFNLPLTVGGYFLSLAVLGVGAAIARAPNPEQMLPVFYLAAGVANPVTFAASRVQTIVLAFPPADRHRRRTLRFALLAGAVLGVLPLAMIVPVAADFYYVRLQNLPAKDLDLVRQTAVALVLFPLFVALRGHSEGLAAWMKKPAAVLAGHAVFLVTTAAFGWSALGLGLPGCLIGALALPLGSFASAMTMRLALRLNPLPSECTPPGTR